MSDLYENKMAKTGVFESKAAALEHLRLHPLGCVEWVEKGVKWAGLYWNGRRVVVRSGVKRRW